ncbi:MAG: recombinase RecA [bacterium]|nr:recombinase RecA [bacterium]
MDDKLKAIEAVVNQLEKQFGKGSIMRLGDMNVRYDEDAISTGALSLDVAIGIGGIPRGRIVEIFGPESSGKTTLALQIVAEAQKKGGIAAYIDVENALDPSYARNIGVDVDNLYISQPDTGEQALEIVDMLVRSQAIDVVVVDSVAALVPKAEIEGDMGEVPVGLQARLMSHALRKLTALINKTKTAAIFINQIREKIGVMFGNPETTPGGKALKYYSSLRLDIRKCDNIKQGSEQIGNRVKVKVVKNKMAPPFKQAEFDIIFNKGISAAGSVVEAAITSGILEKNGSWFSYNGSRIAQGAENTKKYLEDNPEMLQEIIGLVKEKAGLTPASN